MTLDEVVDLDLDDPNAARDRERHGCGLTFNDDRATTRRFAVYMTRQIDVYTTTGEDEFTGQ